MKLEELNPNLLQYSLKDTAHTFENICGRGFDLGVIQTVPIIRVVQKANEANGVEFDCPRCRNTERSHRVRSWFKGVPPYADPPRYRWNASGTFRELNLSVAYEHDFVIDQEDGCRWNGSIVLGEVSNP